MSLPPKYIYSYVLLLLFIFSSSYVFLLSCVFCSSVLVSWCYLLLLGTG